MFTFEIANLTLCGTLLFWVSS